MKNYKFNVNWFTNYNNNYIQGPCFIKELVGKPIKALQIGCFEGMGTVWFLDNILTHPDATLLDIDPFYSDGDLVGADFNIVQGLYYHNLEECEGKNKHNIIVGKSQDILPTLADNSFDFIYVDGSHLKKDVAFDAEQAHRLLKSGGILIFDDYDWDTNDPNVSREWLPHDAIVDFLSKYKDQYKVIDIHYQVVIKKI
jgi:predicted O-methyltransferase YrrM